MNHAAPERSHLCDSHREEVASSATHALGLVFSLAALVVMPLLAAGSALKLFSALVFGISLVLLYGSSTLYHLATTHLWKQRFQALDHACIYLLIAGSYTPFTLVTLRGPWGWSIFGVVWAMAAGGVWVKTRSRRGLDSRISTVLYLVMGWLIVLAIGPLIQRLPAAGLAWLVAGGLAYSLGVVFFAWRRVPYNHAIWHGFVLAGSACHVTAACLFVFR